MDHDKRKKNKELFHKLITLMEHDKFDDDYLRALIAFWQFLPENEVDGNIFYARYALHHKKYDVAYEYAVKAYDKRKINFDLWCILRDACYALGNFEKSIFFAGCADKFYKEPILLDIPQNSLATVLDMFSLAMGRGNYAPVATSRMQMTANGIEAKDAIFAGEFLPEEEHNDGYRLFSGAYVDREMLDSKGKLLDYIKDSPQMSCISGADFVYDLIKVKDRANKYNVSVEGNAILLGLVGSTEHQHVDFKSDHEHTSDYLGKWATSYFRFNENTELTSDAPILCTDKIVLRHDDKRCKVVLNILLDGLCWRAIQEENYELVPNIISFFKKGVVFNNHYSVSEYTFPSVATIETGLYPYRSQIYNEKASHSLNKRYKSISEVLHEQGYYCINIMGDGTGVYNGIFRGYDRLIVNAYDNKIYQGVERTIHQINAFDETDQFIFLHAADTHPWAAHTFQLPIETQTSFSLTERSMKNEKKKPSVYLPNRPIYHHWNKQGIIDCDTALARLFAYLEANYTNDEYLVTLYSDHGVPIYDEKNYILSEHQTGAAFMMRGRGVPEIGDVSELTSALDIYPSLAKCLGVFIEDLDGNLPKILGGEARHYTVSMSMFPGIPYMICIRTNDYECRAESCEILDEDGRVDLENMKIEIFSNGSMNKVYDEKIVSYFHKIIVKETKSIDNNGVHWPVMRNSRPEWFDGR